MSQVCLEQGSAYEVNLPVYGYSNNKIVQVRSTLEAIYGAAFYGI